MPSHEKRRYVVLKMTPNDAALIRSLGKESPDKDRYWVLQQMAQLVDEIDLTPHEIKRKPVRVSMPVELQDVLRETAKKSGLTQIEVLLRLAKKWREKHPLE